ncbi:hypothetical protein Aab01nite_56580 [Paractinoplanes abujensis]|uniref:DUF3566 domain-containing protein n=1 Tax=Paractinoplanes abujensis TaxID=882441 RepID=A0A7W7CYZ1_9ACTN|nr:DUF3566 domain-containing protein [Actinoplanes abujensis]MBB4696080.1 hypothetical protein [Actinoplanes abujensis]GID22068.1 hypothetical protein Aab01nite_56580 [Actinoplanes abujensis]
MPETQAKSGATGGSATPNEAAKKDGAAPNGRDAAGRAAAPADAPATPKFTRAPGMAPPPGEPPADQDGADSKRPGGAVKGSASVPTVTKGKGAAPGSSSGRVSVPPAGNKPGTATGPQQRPGGDSAKAAARPAGAAPGQATGSAAVGAARVTEAVRSARSTVTGAAARGPRRARLNLKRIDPWSVMKFSFAVSVVLFIVVVVATSVLYLALDAMGVWTEVNTSLKELVTATGSENSGSSGGFQITAWGVIGTSMLIGAVNVVLFTALATLGAFIYNVCADLVGGVELTLAERD